MQKTLSLLIVGLLLATAGCSNLGFPGVYRIDIEQGNIIDESMVARLRPGLDPEQVRFVMGSPQVVDPFTPDRWVYLYRLRRGSGERVEGRMVLYFEDGRLARWEGAPVPAEARQRVNTAVKPAEPTPDPANP